jgi:N-methylhydantoinase A/oxoprolinase/acetone carboxylase beta subunit
VRVTPVSWLAHGLDADDAIRYVEEHADDYSISTRQAGFLFATGKDEPTGLSEREKKVLDALRIRPYCLAELAEATNSGHWTMLPVARLIKDYVIQPSGLTPTDVFHAAGTVSLWDQDAAERVLGVYAALSGYTVEAFIEEIYRISDEKALLEILARGLGIEQPVDQLLREKGASDLLEAILSGGNEEVNLSIRLKDPVVGLGAPARLFLERPASFLQTGLIVPRHAEVANAVGAVTSSVHVEKRGSIVPDSRGTFLIEGVEGDKRYDRLEDAEAKLKAYLEDDVLTSAWSAGTASRDVVVEVKDRTSFTADGVEVFLGRSVAVSITGPPDRDTV